MLCAMRVKSPFSQRALFGFMEMLPLADDFRRDPKFERAVAVQASVSIEADIPAGACFEET